MRKTASLLVLAHSPCVMLKISLSKFSPARSVDRPVLGITHGSFWDVNWLRGLLERHSGSGRTPNPERTPDSLAASSKRAGASREKNQSILMVVRFGDTSAATHWTGEKFVAVAFQITQGTIEGQLGPLNSTPTNQPSLLGRH